MRYILHPGEVVSINDGDLHFISSKKLAALYKVPYRDCITLLTPRDFQLYVEQPGDIHLRPSRLGNYTLPDGGNDGKSSSGKKTG